MAMTTPLACQFHVHDGEPQRKHEKRHEHHRKGIKTCKHEKRHEHHPHRRAKSSKHRGDQKGAKPLEGPTLWLGQVLGRAKSGGRPHGAPKVDVKIAFYLPCEYQEGRSPPPKPLSRAIEVNCLPEWTAHVRPFGGFATPRRVMEQFKALHEALEEDGQEAPRRCGAVAVYDPPTELHGRHNEVGARGARPRDPAC